MTAHSYYLTIQKIIQFTKSSPIWKFSWSYQKKIKSIRILNRFWSLAAGSSGSEFLLLCSYRRYGGEIHERWSHRIRVGTRDEQKWLKLSFHFAGWLSRNRDYWLVGEDFRSRVFSLFSKTNLKIWNNFRIEFSHLVDYYKCDQFKPGVAGVKASNHGISIWSNLCWKSVQPLLTSTCKEVNNLKEKRNSMLTSLQQNQFRSQKAILEERCSNQVLRNCPLLTGSVSNPVSVFAPNLE